MLCLESKQVSHFRGLPGGASHLNIPDGGMEGTMVSQDFRKQLEGYGLTTANILYRRPDHPWLLQSYVLAGLRYLPGISGAQQIPQFLARDLGRPVALGHRGAYAVDQACRDPCDRRRVPAALRKEVGLSDVRSKTLPRGLAPARGGAIRFR